MSGIGHSWPPSSRPSSRVTRSSARVSCTADGIEEQLMGSDPDPAALRRLRVLLTKADALMTEAALVAEDAAPPPPPAKRRRGRRGPAPDGTRDRPTWAGWADDDD
jgi:hypothetical protein